MKIPTELTLEGKLVTLEPLRGHHSDALKIAVGDGDLWNLWHAAVPSPQQMDGYIDEALRAVPNGNLAFAVVDRSNRKVIGTTRYYNMDVVNDRGMLGYTWYAKSAQGTKINTECKLLLLQHFFEVLGAQAIEFRTHSFNAASRRAIEKLGAKQDGILRSHQIWKDGSIRDTVVYSIIASEWPSVKANLLFALAS